MLDDQPKIGTTFDLVPRGTDQGKPAADRAGLAYLEASGVNAISITTGTGGTVIAVGYKPGATEIFWLPQEKARSVAARARKLLSANAPSPSTGSTGDSQGGASVVAALHEAATELRATLTPHDVAMARAHVAAERLDEIMRHLRDMGALRQFGKAYKARRMAAAAKGEGYAELRLKRALIPLIQSGKPAVGASLFREVFDA